MLRTAGRAEVHWLLVGDGPDRSAVETATAGRVAATFLGWQPSERMSGLTSLMDIGVATHLFYTGPFYFCPLKILEYAAAGCAVLASNQGDIPALLDNGRAGVLVGSPDPVAWAGALGGLLDNPAQIRVLGAHGRQWVLGHRTWRHTAEGVAGVLQQAVTGKGGLRK